ncbi:winged helix-turn-helix transcriptional regulator [Phormidium tenue FACHB-886]|nr:winged helix-turn-helix transcriptional regulator [Phormidium tenue FACHB-886]
MQVSVKSLLGDDLDSGSEAWIGLLRVYGALQQRLDMELQAAHQLPLVSYEALLYLAIAPDQKMRLSELANTVLLSLSGVSRLVDRLVKAGLVMRETAAEDGRGAYAVLTAAGLTMLRSAHKTHLEGVRKHFLQHFTAEELVLLGSFWERLLPGASRHIQEAQQPESP